MLHEKKYIGTYRNEQEVLEVITELKQVGYKGPEIYVVSHKEDDIQMVQGRTDVELEITDTGNLLDHVKAFLNGDAPVREAFERMGIPTREAEDYATKSREGYILIFVDRSYDGALHAGESQNLDGTGIGQRRPIAKDPIEVYEAKVGAEATFERDRIIKDAELQREIKKTPRRLADMEQTEGSGAGIVGRAHHEDEQDRTIKSPKNPENK